MQLTETCKLNSILHTRKPSKIKMKKTRNFNRTPRKPSYQSTKMDFQFICKSVKLSPQKKPWALGKSPPKPSADIIVQRFQHLFPTINTTRQKSCIFSKCTSFLFLPMQILDKKINSIKHYSHLNSRGWTLFTASTAQDTVVEINTTHLYQIKAKTRAINSYPLISKCLCKASFKQVPPLVLQKKFYFSQLGLWAQGPKCVLVYKLSALRWTYILGTWFINLSLIYVPWDQQRYDMNRMQRQVV